MNPQQPKISHNPERHLILFDGVCHLCQGSVQFVIKNDKRQRFFFAALQSDFAQKLLNENHIEANLSSIIYIIQTENLPPKIYQRSTAALTIAKNLGGMWSLFYGFMLMPKFIRDGIYKLIAKNRYRWFGRSESCLMPSKALNKRFLG